MLKRREFLRRASTVALGTLVTQGCRDRDSDSPAPSRTAGKTFPKSEALTLFLCGDVMTGRGIDQVLPHPSDPELHEQRAKSATVYVSLAEEANGLIPMPVSFSYIWGDALKEIDQVDPDARIINLETSVTTSEDWTPKGINYRMHPANIPCLTAAGIDCCALANNHVMDFGESGLAQTLDTLRKANLKPAGAGRNLAEAQAPAVIELPGQARVIVFSFGAHSSGIPGRWAARDGRPGVNFLPDLSDETMRRIAARVHSVRQQSDVVVASIHWGGNWDYSVSPEQRAWAHKLVDEAGVDIVHGHSSHHAKGIEVYKNKPVLYGCGDFLDDYEGIGGHEEFRGDLALAYFLTVDRSTRRLLQLKMRPFEIKRLQLHRAMRWDARWLRDTLHREGKNLGTGVTLDPDNTLRLQWRQV